MFPVKLQLALRRGFADRRRLRKQKQTGLQCGELAGGSVSSGVSNNRNRRSKCAGAMRLANMVIGTECTMPRITGNSQTMSCGENSRISAPTSAVPANVLTHKTADHKADAAHDDR